MSLGLLCMLIVFVNLVAGSLIAAFAVSRDASNDFGSTVRRSFFPYVFPVMGAVVALFLAAFLIGWPTRVVVHQVGTVSLPSAVAVPGTTQVDLTSANAYGEGSSAGARLAAQVGELPEPVSRYSGRSFVLLALAVTAIGVLVTTVVVAFVTSREVVTDLGTAIRAYFPMVFHVLLPGGFLLLLFLFLGMRYTASPVMSARPVVMTDVAAPMMTQLSPGASISQRLNVPAVKALHSQESAESTTESSSANQSIVSRDEQSPDPHWLSAGPETANGTTILVFKSGQYATEQEARTDADGQLFHAVTTDLAQYRRQRWLALRPEPLTIDKVRHYVLASHVQSVTRDFGTFRAPMHRVWYQVEFSPRKREPLLASPSSLDRDARLQLVLTALAALFLVPFGIVTTGAARRRAPGFVGTCLSLLVGVSLAAVWVAMAFKLNQIVVLW